MKLTDVRPGMYKGALEITWLAVIFLVPLFFNPRSYQIVSISKDSLLLFLVAAMLAFCMADWLLNRAGHRGLDWKGILSPLHITILVFGLVAALATAASITPAISFWGTWSRKAGLITLICWIIFFFIVSHQLRHRAQIFRAIYTLLLSSGIVSALGIIQSFSPDLMFKMIHSTYAGRVFSTIGNPLFLSSYLAMVIPFNLAFIVYFWSRRKEKSSLVMLTCLAILLVLQFWCLWLAQYSITILLFIIAPIIFIMLLGWTRRKKLLLGFGAVCLLCLGIMASLLLSPMLLPNTNVNFPEGAPSQLPLTAEGLELKTLDWRVQYWRSATDIIINSPEVPFSDDKLHFLRRFIGYGQETFVVTFQLFSPEKLRSSSTYGSELIDHPHNHYLYLATTTGLLGLISFLSILAAFFYLCWRYLRRAKTDIDGLLLVAMTAALAQYMADIFLNIPSIAPDLVFWLILAMTPAIGRFAGIENSAGDDIEEVSPAENVETPCITRTSFFLSLGCALVLIFIGTLIAVRPFLADMYFLKGLNMQREGNEQAIYNFEKATRLNPGESAYWHFLGTYSDSVARHVTDDALKMDVLSVAWKGYDKALASRYYIGFEHYFLADVHTYWTWTGTVDKWDTAMSLYNQASQLFPDNAVILNKWSLALLVKGDYDEAQAKLEQATSVDPDWAETSFLYGFVLAVKAKNDEAALKLTAPIENNSSNLNYFIDVCQRLASYEMLSPLKNTLETHADKAPDDWIAHALVGIVHVFYGNAEKSLYEFNTAMMLVPDSNSGDLFRAIYRLSSMSPPLKSSLPARAVEWQSKLSQSPEWSTLFPAFDLLMYNAE